MFDGKPHLKEKIYPLWKDLIDQYLHRLKSDLDSFVYLIACKAFKVKELLVVNKIIERERVLFLIQVLEFFLLLASCHPAFLPQIVSWKDITSFDELR